VSHATGCLISEAVGRAARPVGPHARGGRSGGSLRQCHGL